jgi:hypothetical protein
MKSLEKVPWFAVAGILVVVNLLMVRQSGDFMNVVVPSYLTQALLYIALGYGFLREHASQGFTVFLMAGDWLLTTILVWNGVANAAVLWLLFMVQLALAFMFFTNYKLKFAGDGGATWTHAAVWLVFLFGLGKLFVGLAGTTLAQMPLWGLGILLMSFGYIIKPVEKDWATPIQAIGCLIAAVSALTLTAPGLQLLP